MSRRTSRSLPAAAVLACALALASAATAAADTTAPATTPATLTVDATGQVNVTPDLANLQVVVNRSASTARVALSETNARGDLITRAIRDLGVPASGIQTAGASVSNTSHKTGPAGKRHLVRQFTASETLSITSAAKLAGPVLDTATRDGASAVNGLSFSFSNPAAGQIAANNAALANGQQQANAAAAKLGCTITGVQSIDLNPQSDSGGSSSSGSGSPTNTTAPVSKPTPTDVHPGVQQVDAEVVVVYLIAPASP